MYVRKEKIEEENLDCGKYTNPSEEMQEKTAEKAKEEGAGAPVSQKKKLFLKQSTQMAKFKQKINIKNELNDLLKQNAEISLLVGVVFVPYILGFAISYFLFFIYGGVSISNFLILPQAPSTIELWSIGAYLFVTVGAVLAFFAP